MIMTEARRLHVSHPGGDPEFAASSGWIRRFMVRNKITIRRRTTMAQCLPRELGDKVASCISQIRHMRSVHNNGARNSAAMDETGLWLDMPAKTTLNERGARTVAVRTTGHVKDRFKCFSCQSRWV